MQCSYECLYVTTPKHATASQTLTWLAFFWGLMTFMPVGMNYLALLLLLLGVLASRDVQSRWQRLKEGLLWPSLLLFGGWTLLVLAVQPVWYAQSPSNLWHGLRIGLTLALAASLTTREAIYALRGFMLACAGVVCLVLAHHMGVLESHVYWQHLLAPGTNKTIGASILLSMAVAVLVARALDTQDGWRWGFLLAALLIMGIVVDTLSKRTAMVGILIALAVTMLHLWRDYKWRWSLALGLLAVAGAVLWQTVPELQAQFMRGIKEVREGLSGEVKVESWNVRIQMIRHTLDMIAERPLLGWGIGAWNEQWASRVPAEIAAFNMPHNDLLWMGAQGGVVASLAWLVLMLSGLGLAWKARGWQGAAAAACILVATFSALVNNGTRDAIIGLPMLWVMGVMISLARVDASRVQERLSQ